MIAPAQVQSQHIHLTNEQRHYLHRVLRLQVADRFIAMDGQGQSWLASLMATETASAQILEPIRVESELSVAITLVAALPKGSGFDEVVRQATELGVAYIAPVLSDRTLLNPSPQKLERWRRIAQEAAEQSERQIVPAILEPVSFVDSLASSNTSSRFLCVTRVEAPHLLDCLQQGTLQNEITVAIGPEGGWTEAEVEQAIAAGYQPVSLGDRILRAVTAPLVALTLIAAACETGHDS